MVVLPELDGLPVPSRLRIIACGTSYHAGMWGQHLLENWARMPVVPEIASEFRYRNVILEPDDMVLVISQSGGNGGYACGAPARQGKGLYRHRAVQRRGIVHPA